MREMLKHKLKVIIGVPLNSLQAKTLLRKNRKKLDSCRRNLLYGGQIMRHIKCEWSVDMGKGEIKIIPAHLFYNPLKAAENRNRYEKTILELSSKAAEENFSSMKEANMWINENTRMYSKCFCSAKDDETGKICVIEKPNKIAQATANMGFSIVLAAGIDNIDSPEYILDIYRARDSVEKIYDALKNENGQYRLRTADDNSAQGRFFLAFISLVLRAELLNRISQASFKKKISVPSILDELRKIKSVVSASGKKIFLEVSKKQKEIISRLRLTSLEHFLA